MVYDYWQGADNPTIRLDAKYAYQNVRIQNGLLQLRQVGYSQADLSTRKAISIAGIQSRALDIVHGTFRSVFKLEGANGGSCASFFWYHDDVSEIDIEAVTKGTSLVNNTINYTSQPSLFADGTRIPNATLSIPLADEFNTNLAKFHEHRFDCDIDLGVKFYLDNSLTHIDRHNIPQAGGNLQIKLWADGNKWWSGQPSSTDVIMSIKSIIAYYNTSGTQDGSDKKWFEDCRLAGGPGDKTICTAFTEAGKPHENGDDLILNRPSTTLSNTASATVVSSTSSMVIPQPKASPSRSQATRLRVQLPFPLIRTRSINSCLVPKGCGEVFPISTPFGTPVLNPAIRNAPPAWLSWKAILRYQQSYHAKFIPSQILSNRFEDSSRLDQSIKTSLNVKTQAPSWFPPLYNVNQTQHCFQQPQLPYITTVRVPRSPQSPSQQAPSAKPILSSDNPWFENCRGGDLLPCKAGPDTNFVDGMKGFFKCLKARPDFCLFWNASNTFTSGVVQVFSVPAVFVWVYWLSAF